MAGITPQEVSTYFSEKLGEKVEVTSLKQTFPGVSRETWLVAAHVGGHSQGFALRLDPPEGASCPAPLKLEYDVYSKLHGSKVPVAEPLWFGADNEFGQGRPHMVRRLVEGTTKVAGLTAAGADGSKLRMRIAFEVMEKLALVHRLDWHSLGLGEILPVPTSPANSLGAEFAIWRRYWNEGRPNADPVLEEALCWLSENIPTDTPRISLVKGNNGIGEEIWQGEKIVAMSDWELASLGDGALDLGFSQGTMQLADFREILRHYEGCVGEQVSPERLAFSAFLIWLKQIVCLRVFMYRLYMEGKSRRILGLSFGLVHTTGPESRLASCIGKDIVSAWSDVVATERSMYTRVGESA